MTFSALKKGFTLKLNLTPSSDYFTSPSHLLRHLSMTTITTRSFLVLILTLSILILSFSAVSHSEEISLIPTLSPHTQITPTTLTRLRRDDSSTLQGAERLIPKNYSIHEPPPPDPGREDESILMEFYVLVVGVPNIQEVTEEIQIELNLQIFWKDTRLSHLADKSPTKFVVLNPVLLQQIWHPDVFIDHVKKVEQPKLISTPESLRIYADSTLRYSGRVTITMACNFDFHYFPADTQRCPIEFKSYAYSDRILRLDWRDRKEPSIKKNLRLPNFQVGLGYHQNFTVPTSSGQYSAISFTLILRRFISFHMINTYLPSAIFIVVSWLSFLVSPESIPGRMTLCITTLLTITAMFSSVRQNIPNVSYIKALDVWMVTCIFFVFFTLLEFTTILKLKSMKPNPALAKKSDQPAETPNSHPNGVSNKYILIAANNMGDKPSDMPIWVTQGTTGASGDTPDQNTRTGYCDLRLRHPGEDRYLSGSHIASSSSSNSSNRTTTSPVHNLLHSAPMTVTASPTSVHQSQPVVVGTPVLSSSPVPPPPTTPANPYEPLVEKIEYIMSKMIPAAFLLFNFIYWPWLMIFAEYFNEQEFDKTHYAL